MQPQSRHLLLGFLSLSALVFFAVSLQLPRVPLFAEVMPSGQAAPQASSGTARLWISALKYGHPVKDLKEDELELWVGKEKQKISSLTFDPPVPLVLGFIVDASGSERLGWPGPELNLAHDFLQKVLRPVDQVFLADFNDKSHLDAGPTADLSQIEQGLEKIRALRPYGGTALFDTIEASCDLLKTRAGARHLLVVVTDGLDNASRHTRLQAVRAARLSNTSVSIIFRPAGQLESSSVGTHSPRTLIAMQDVTQATGGLLAQPSASEADIGRDLDAVANFVRAQYAVDFNAGSSISEGDKMKVKCLRHHVKIFAPEQY